MKKIVLLTIAIALSCAAMAQKELAFPFQGGQQVMSQFFQDNFKPSAEMISAASQGVVLLKFTADLQGAIKRTVVYYADDVNLAQPVADLLLKSNEKWIIPDREKSHDLILTVNVRFGQTGTQAVAARKRAALNFYKRTPLLTTNQVPLDMATLLPTVTVIYDATLQK